MKIDAGFFRSITENQTDMIWAMEVDLSTLYIGPSIKDFLGYTPEEAGMMPPERYLTQSSSKIFKKALSESSIKLLENRPVILELEYIKKDGSIIWAETKITNLRNEQHESMGLLCISRDISWYKKIEEELAEVKEIARIAGEAKNQFLYSMNHELRTPLTSIIGFSELLKEGHAGPLNTRQKEYANDIFQSGRHLLSMINDILDLSVIESKGLALIFSEFNIKGFLKNALLFIKNEAYKKDIHILLEIDTDLPEIVISDERRLKQVFFNLLSNAVKFNNRGGKIIVEAKRIKGSEIPGKKSFRVAEKGFLKISITDTGMGINPEDQKRIFDKFYQVKGQFSDKTEGAGLGLSLSRHILELLGGHIWVESRGSMQGSSFSLVLPIG